MGRNYSFSLWPFDFDVTRAIQRRRNLANLVIIEHYSRFFHIIILVRRPPPTIQTRATAQYTNQLLVRTIHCFVNIIYSCRQWRLMENSLIGTSVIDGM